MGFKLEKRSCRNSIVVRCGREGGLWVKDTKIKLSKEDTGSCLDPDLISEGRVGRGGGIYESASVTHTNQMVGDIKGLSVAL